MIAFLDLQAQQQEIRPELEAAALEVLRSGEYVQGRCVREFEDNFAAFCGARHAIAVNSGTSALHLALLAAGIGPGDEVITVPATFVATVAAIIYARATPVLVDIDPATLTLDPALLERAVTRRTRAIIPVHLHGRIGDMEAVTAIARQHRAVVIEDAAQAHGAERAGRHAGTFGDAGCFSFYPGKNLGACGEGGAVVTDRADIAHQVRLLRDWGQVTKHDHVRHAFNCRMDNIQGAILDVKLRRLKEWNAKRRQIAALYDRLLEDGGVLTPLKPAGHEHAYHVYAIRTPFRARLRVELEAAGIATAMHYPRCVHLQPAYAGLGYREGDFPVSEAFSAETLSLPIYPELTQSEVHKICEAIRRICRGAANSHAA